MLRALFAISLLVASAAGAAQTMYRCGNTFSQTPCSGQAGSAPAPRADAGAPAAPGATARTRAAPCLAEAAQRVGVADAAALRVGPITGPRVQAIDVRGSKLVVRTYEFSALARNAYGGEAAGAAFTCHLSEDEQRVVQLVERPAAR
jgi:hypothetical protein